MYLKTIVSFGTLCPEKRHIKSLNSDQKAPESLINMNEICVPVKAVKPQWIVQAHCIVSFDTIFCKAGLGSRDSGLHWNKKTAWNSTISVIEVLVYRATDKRAHA
ncbi:hypothetical protein SAMN05444267_1008136 [Chryseobacterium polytrichastri]|uniref:Uncharacterized protein n=1 Tax=Chryseobacterium polytrichastri TaxID=1302687 RepID=A0A1M6VTF1_9FLAO|nr:hypothetical protein SAMN05444267_1008136 [Chryseobacterium polytrichastri]